MTHNCLRLRSLQVRSYGEGAASSVSEGAVDTAAPAAAPLLRAAARSPSLVGLGLEGHVIRAKAQP